MAGELPSLPQPPGHGLPPGPTPWSNWVIPGRVLAGAYPASMDDLETETLLTLLLELGVNTFVCLQAEVNIHIPDHSWRAGLGLRPYIRDAQRLLSRAQAAGSGSRIRQRKVDFLHLPIIDGSVTADGAMSRLADDCCERVLRGEVLYIHCWGGHGRTGTLVAVMLGRLYGLPYSAALRHTQAAHDSRVFPQGVRSPQTTVQRAQVKRLLMLPNPFAAVAARMQRQAAAAACGEGAGAQQQHFVAALGGSSSGGGAGGAPCSPSPSKAAAATALAGPATPIKQAATPASLARPGVGGRAAQPVAAGAVAGGAGFGLRAASPPGQLGGLNISLVARMQQLALGGGSAAAAGGQPAPARNIAAPPCGSAAAAAVMAAGSLRGKAAPGSTGGSGGSSSPTALGRLPGSSVTTPAASTASLRPSLGVAASSSSGSSSSGLSTPAAVSRVSLGLRASPTRLRYGASLADERESLRRPLAVDG